ncbi:MAG: hypothetical protein NVS1B14_08360 [Vulcanimicrobiaceae bacterium]
MHARLRIAALTGLLALGLFHRTMALALVARGDEFLARGEIARARSPYARALLFAPSLSVAMDRYVFYAIEEGSRDALRGAASAASDYLRTYGWDAKLLQDRALCYQALKDYRRASFDFTAVARIQRSAQSFTFAGWAHYRAGHVARARLLWRAALHVNAAYGPARAALRRTRAS